MRILKAVIGMLIALVVLFYVGDIIARVRSGGQAWGLSQQTPLGLTGWVTWTLVGLVFVGVIGAFFAQKEDLWKVGTREVVYMAIGAVLYGVLSWVTNVTTIVVPSVSLVALRPAVVIPPLFGYLFGPVVGFFTGAFGNVLGDAITGWGVFPAWDIGNGLMGMIPGLIFAFEDRKRATQGAGILTVVLLVILTLLTIFSPEKQFANPITGQMANHAAFWWVLLVGAVLIAVFLYFVNRNYSDALALAVWGALGTVIGIGFAAIADIWINGYTFFVAMLGEFLPAAGPDILFTAVLGPILYQAYQEAVGRTGR